MKNLKKLSSISLLTLILFLPNLSFANQEIRENSKDRVIFREEVEPFAIKRYVEIERHYYDKKNARVDYEYEEYYDNCWWKGTLKRTSLTFDHNYNWYVARYAGNIYKKDCFKSYLFNNKNIISNNNLIDSEDDSLGYSPKFRSIKIAYTKGTDYPKVYYYEEWDPNYKCMFGAYLRLSDVKEKGSKYIVEYSGYINAAC